MKKSGRRMQRERMNGVKEKKGESGGRAGEEWVEKNKIRKTK